MAEIYAYLACAMAAAWMTTISYATGRPPLVYWFFVLICVIGIVRIFTLAWQEDRRDRSMPR